jgi:hypothetical protein
MRQLLSEKVWNDPHIRDLHFGGALLHEALIEQENLQHPRYYAAGPPLCQAAPAATTNTTSQVLPWRKTRTRHGRSRRVRCTPRGTQMRRSTKSICILNFSRRKSLLSHYILALREQ